MVAKSRTCPKCSGAMADGFVATKNDYGAALARWVEGVPHRSLWTGLKLRGTTPVDIVTARCRRCGYLESYAPPE